MCVGLDATVAQGQSVNPKNGDYRDNNLVIGVASGALYSYDHNTGGYRHAVNRSFIEAMDNVTVHSLRLHLGAEFDAIEMKLTQDSAWTRDSVVVVRRGEQTEEFRDLVNSDCFLTGRLTSHDGVITLDRCGRLSGVVHTGNRHYQIEGVEERGHPEEFSNMKVTARLEVNLGRLDYTHRGEEWREANDGAQMRTRRDTSGRIFPPATVEAVAYLDKNFVEHQGYANMRYSTEALSRWIISKWNVFRSVMAKKKEIGFPLTLLLKKIEIWRHNPAYYSRQIGPNNTTGEVLKTFCQLGPDQTAFDHRMLYTLGLGTFEVGMAYLDGICSSKIKCSMVKSKDDPVKIELHEFGHNIGLKHDPKLEPCTDPDGDGGFMGWGYNYRILDCYRRVLRQKIRQSKNRCLFETNIPHLNRLN